MIRYDAVRYFSKIKLYYDDDKDFEAIVEKAGSIWVHTEYSYIDITGKCIYSKYYCSSNDKKSKLKAFIKEDIGLICKEEVCTLTWNQYSNIYNNMTKEQLESYRNHILEVEKKTKENLKELYKLEKEKLLEEKRTNRKVKKMIKK